MKTLILGLFLWIGAETDYNVNLPVPQVVKVSQTQLEEMYYGKSKKNDFKLHALYSRKKDIIYLSDSWNMYNAFDRGVLLHELLHYVQDMNNVQYDCMGQLEAEVYPLQKKYLLEVHGVKFEYDELFVKSLSFCNDY